MINGKDIVKIIKEMKMKNEGLMNQLNEANTNFEKTNEELNEEKNQLYQKINEIQKELDYHKRLVEEFRQIIPNKNDDECLKIIERDHQFGDEIRSNFKGKTDNDIIEIIHKDVTLSFNIRKFFSSGDDSWIMNQIQSDHNRIPEIFEHKTNITNLQNNINQMSNDKNKYQDIIKELETKEQEHSIIIQKMKNDNQRLREENNKIIQKMKDYDQLLLERNQFCKNIIIDQYNVLSFQMQKFIIDNLSSNEMTNKIQHLLNYLSQNTNLENTCIEIASQNKELQHITNDCVVKFRPYLVENLCDNKILNRIEFIDIINEFKTIQFGMIYPSQSFQNIYSELKANQFNHKTKIEIGVHISPSITSIEKNIFFEFPLLTHIKIPSSITSIDNFSFDSCTSLESIEIPSSVKFIGRYAFSNCSSLTKVLIPSSITSINDYTFNRCVSLKEILIPSSVTLIGEGAFLNCSSLTQVSIPSSVTSIKDYAFASCSSLTQISIPPSVTSIRLSAFLDCSSLKQATNKMINHFINSGRS